MLMQGKVILFTVYWFNFNPVLQGHISHYNLTTVLLVSCYADVMVLLPVEKHLLD